MSEYLVVESDFTSKKHIIAGLLALGVPAECIEQHSIAVPLKGYRGDTREQRANIVVRAEHVNKYLSGGASNDLGFELVNGNYVTRVSKYDRGKWWQKKEQKFMDEAVTARTIEQAKKRGYRITREEVDGEIHLKVSKRY